ncbi:MAG: diguanylate cyclase [Hyphomicrobiales bacterium]
MDEVTDFLKLLADPDALQLMLFACPDGVVMTDPVGRVVLYAGASESIFGFAPIEVLRKDVSGLFATADGYAHFRHRLEHDDRLTNMEVMACRKDSGPFAAAISAAVLRDRYGSPVGTVMYVRDHTKVRGIEEALRKNNRRLNALVRTLNHVAQHDQLTGMLYRGSAIEAAEAAILSAGLDNTSFGVALFDLDHFKSVNDSYGHLVGDEVLAALAGVLRSAARQDDIVGRFGGEEFIAFLPGAGIEAVRNFAERVRVAVSNASITVGDAADIAVTVSAGVSAMPGGADTLEEAIRLADDRLLAAKRAGRNRVIWTDTEEEQPAA